jgi:hypothetical protein
MNVIVSFMIYFAYDFYNLRKVVLGAPKLEGPVGKIPYPYMASPPLGISNIELLPKYISEVILLHQNQMCF